MFDWFGQNPDIGVRFGSMMVAWVRNKPFWADERAYPVKERLNGVEAQDDVLIVDVGGGKGHDLAEFKSRFPEIQGRLVCQELPYLVPEIKVEGVEPMAHDFRNPQPVKGKSYRKTFESETNSFRGAKAYFFHHILHDYSDEECIQILKQVVPVMKPGYSKILIAESIVLDMNAHYTATGLDLELMQCLAASERTESQFRDLLGKAGLKVAAIFKHPQAHDSIIEAIPI